MNTMSIALAPARATASVAGARENTRHFLHDLLPVVAAEAADAVVLVVSELVTNALRHGAGICVLDLTEHPDGVEVAVHDDSPRPPQMRAPDLIGGAGGFGWPMVNHLARATSITPRPTGGKTVSALLAR
ncbi:MULTISPECIES: ATP-binding protein [unclassified Streptomyces]|uniref:ATP-binding protein n=1 Tax=unclassified Streptomyces TaxID=2593676 RepID=UPI0037B3B136